MKKDGLQKRLLTVLLVLLGIAILAVSAVLLSYHFGYKADRDAYNDLKKTAFEADEPANQDSSINLSALREVNEDAVGWIEACNGTISGPIVSSEDDDYYLNHRFDKREARCGTFFADRFTSPAFMGPLTIIYGHNMQDGSMFHELLRYKKEDYLKENNTFTIYTENGPEEYKIFSVFYADYYDIPWIADRCKKGSPGEGQSLDYNSRGGLGMADYLKIVSRRSLINIDADYAGHEHEAKIALLCTCEYTDVNNRFLVYGIHLSV